MQVIISPDAVKVINKVAWGVDKDPERIFSEAVMLIEFYYKLLRDGGRLLVEEKDKAPYPLEIKDKDV